MKKIYTFLFLVMSLVASQKSFAGDEIAPQEDVKINQNKVKFAGGLGVGYNTYNSNVVSIGQTSLVTKFGASYRPQKLDKWVFSLSGFFTALPFNSTVVHVGSVTEAASIRYLGVNARVGWDTPWLTGNWKLQLNFGWYYNTTFVTDNLFGYVGANGPQFFPTIEYSIDENSSIGGYLKFSPMSTGLSFLNSSLNYEAAIGAYYMFPGLLFGKYKHTINLDFAHLSIKPDLIRAYSNSTSIGLGVLF